MSRLTASTPTAYLFLLVLCCFAGCLAQPVVAQRHPPEVRGIYPLGGRPGTATHVTITGVSLRDANRILFDRPGISAKIIPADRAKLPAQTPDSDGDPPVTADITISKDVPTGICSFRITAPGGVSNIGKWAIGRDIPQSEEIDETGKPVPASTSTQTPRKAQKVGLPAAVNGRIATIGEEDTYAISLTRGKAFVAEVVAAAVGSPLDSLLTLRNASGQEVASNDDYNGSDSLLVYTPKASGRYLLTIASGVGQGGPSHAYRLSMGALPLLTAIFPAGVEPGKSTLLTACGTNLPPALTKVFVVGSDTIPHAEPVPFPVPGGTTNALPVIISPLPIVSETPGHDRFRPLTIPIPCAVNGRFLRPAALKSGSVSDYYRFKTEAGRRCIFEAQCHSLGTKGNPLLTLYAADGTMLEESDGAGGQDARIDRTFDKAGSYTLRVRDLQERSSPELVYRLTAQELPPGFSLSAETRSRSLGAGGSVALEIAIVRDRWEGAVIIGAQNLPSDVSFMPCLIPAGVGRGVLVLTAAANAQMVAFPLTLIGTGTVEGGTVQRTVALSDWVWNGGGRTNVAAVMPYFAVTGANEVAPTIMASALNLLPGMSLKIAVHLVRAAGYNKPVTLHLLGLPDGIAAADVVVPGDKSDGELELKADPKAKPGSYGVAVLAVVGPTPNVQIDRSTPAITITVAAPK